MALSQQELVDLLSSLSLFADLSRPQLEQVAHKMTEESVPQGQRILRQGFTGTGFYVILDGEAAVRIDGEERARAQQGRLLRRDVGAARRATGGRHHCPAPTPPTSPRRPELEGFLRDHPPVMLRMLKTVALRLRNANRWRS
jgi:CRP-like cAMP-binding protein